jgi:Skp family chaperone for outer membrane proteins
MAPMKLTLLGLGAAFALTITACQPPASTSAPAAPNGTIAIIDLDAVAKRLGRDVAITEQLKSKNDTLSETLTKERDKLQGELNSQQQSLGDKPSDAQKEEFAKLGQGLNAQLQTKLQAAREELNSQQVDLVRQFREEVKPVAQKVAAKKGMNVVFMRSDIVVLSADTAVDITDDVVADMITSGKGTPKPSAPTAP